MSINFSCNSKNLILGLFCQKKKKNFENKISKKKQTIITSNFEDYSTVTSDKK